MTGMHNTVSAHLQQWVHRKEQLLPFGYNWPFIVSVDVAIFCIGTMAVLQRPVHEWPTALVALLVAFAPGVVFVSINAPMFQSPWLYAAWMSGTAILLFSTSTPIEGDFAPILLALTVGVAGALTTLIGGSVATSCALGLIGSAWWFHRLDTPLLYVAFVGIGWLVGYLMRCQRQLLVKQRRTEEQLAGHAAAEERRRLAREVHDVIAHSLSITLLHLTAARHRLQIDRHDDEAVRALEQAELLGRHAMADIRNTVGLLGDGSRPLTPEPAASDIYDLTDNFVQAGLDITCNIRGDLEQVSGAAGHALYRIVQESLSNVAKHAPTSPVTLTLTVSDAAAALVIVNEQADGFATATTRVGRGVPGMRQRIELLHGTIEVGPSAQGWSVRATVPLCAIPTPSSPSDCLL